MIIEYEKGVTKLYDPISEKYCCYNLKWSIDTEINQTDILIKDKNDNEYHITIPTAHLSAGDIFEIVNDFVKIIVVHTCLDIADYF